MLLKVIGDASRLLECSVIGIVHTDIYLTDTDISNYTRAYFGDNWKASIIKSNNQFILTNQVVFNAIIFLTSDELPIGYAVLDNEIDMVTQGITSITFDLTSIYINNEYNIQVAIGSICDYSGHISSESHPRLTSLNQEVTSSGYIKSLKPKSSSVTGNLQEALLGKRYTHTNDGGIFNSRISVPSVITNTRTASAYRVTRFGGSILLTEETDFSHMNELYYIDARIVSDTLELTKYILTNNGQWSSSYTRVVLNRATLLMLTSDYIVRYYNNSLHFHSLRLVTKESVLASVISNYPDFSISSDQVGCCRNLITNGVCLYEISNGKFSNSLNSELDDLIDKLNCSVTIKQASIIYGYTDTMIIYGNGTNTYIRSLIPINNRLTYMYPDNVKMVRVINERAILLLTSDGTWRLLRLRANEGLTGFTTKCYNLGTTGHWGHINLLTNNKVAAMANYNPVMYPGNGMIYFSNDENERLVI